MSRRSKTATPTRSHCPVNFALEAFGDHWSFIIIRDIVFWGKHTFKEFSQSSERIATNILSARLGHLVEVGILERRPDPADKRKVRYDLTDRGLDLIPMLLEMSGWASRYDPDTVAPPDFVARVYADRDGMFALVRETIARGGSIFAGEDSVVAALAKESRSVSS